MSIPGSNIRTLRKQLGLTITALAQAAEMDPGNLSRLETGKQGTTNDVLARIAKVLRVSVGVLFAEPGVVEAAALRMREIPVLTAKLLAQWKGQESLDLPDDHPFLYASLRRASPHCFAIRVDDAANAPAVQEGDELIFDANRKPAQQQIVCAQAADGTVWVGRFRLDEQSTNQFSVVPLDRFFRYASTTTDPGLALRGTLIELRRYS